MSHHEEKTLCALQDEGFIKTDTAAFKLLIAPARHFCKSCGRSAVNEANLCKPKKI